jgi:hypothetical protein
MQGMPHGNHDIECCVVGCDMDLTHQLFLKEAMSAMMQTFP